MARDEIYDIMKAHSKEKFDADRKRHLANAFDDGGWVKHTPFHWSRTIDGDRLNYWPSRKKYQFKGKVRRGDVSKLLPTPPTEDA
jgi:hypothetical protein